MPRIRFPSDGESLDTTASYWGKGFGAGAGAPQAPNAIDNVNRLSALTAY